MGQLLLLHGALSSKKQFDNLIPLLDSKLNARAIDFSGHGSKALYSGNYTPQLFSIDILEHVDEPVDLFGYSMGGYAAMYMALKNPFKVNRVMTLSTKYHWTPDIAGNEIMKLDPDMLLEKAPDFVKSLDAQHTANNWRDVVTNTQSFLADLGKNNYLHPDCLTFFLPKVHLALGDKDKMVSLAETEAINRALPESVLSVLPETPHQFERMDPGMLSKLINNFFA